MNESRFDDLLLVDGHLDYFHLLVITNSAAMDIHVQAFA